MSKHPDTPHITLPPLYLDEYEKKLHKDMEVYQNSFYWHTDQQFCIYEGEGYNTGDRFIRHGHGKNYWSNGMLHYEGCFQHDCACGHGRLYNETGILEYEGELWLGYAHGKGKWFYENNKLHAEGIFFRGNLNGNIRYYHESGILSYEGEVKDGNIHGFGRKYNKDGTLYFEGISDMGDAKKGRLYENGILHYEGTYAKHQFSGSGRLYADNGILLYEGAFKCGEYDGFGRLYDEQTGHLLKEGTFSMGKFISEDSLPAQSDSKEEVMLSSDLSSIFDNLSDYSSPDCNSVNEAFPIFSDDFP